MEGLDPRSDGQLLAATAGDPEAFAIFYRRHVRGVLGFFRRRMGSAELAYDLTAETFAAALEASPRYELRPEPARGWLYGIAGNKLHEAQRRGRRGPRPPGAGDGADRPHRRGDRAHRGAQRGRSAPAVGGSARRFARRRPCPRAR